MKKIKNMIYIEPCEETLRRFEDNSIDLIITSGNGGCMKRA